MKTIHILSIIYFIFFVCFGTTAYGFLPKQTYVSSHLYGKVPITNMTKYDRILAFRGDYQGDYYADVQNILNRSTKHKITYRIISVYPYQHNGTICANNMNKPTNYFIAGNESIVAVYNQTTNVGQWVPISMTGECDILLGINGQPSYYITGFSTIDMYGIYSIMTDVSNFYIYMSGLQNDNNMILINSFSLFNVHILSVIAEEILDN